MPRLLQPVVQLPPAATRCSTRSRSRNFDDPATPRRFRFGFIASSDNHSARPGTGYKEFARQLHDRDRGRARRGLAAPAAGRRPAGARAESVPFDPADPTPGVANLPDPRLRAAGVVLHDRRPGRRARRGSRSRRDLERAQASRGLRHQRRAHPALVRSAERPGRARARWAPRSRLDATPRFRVRAVGSFKQQPGCPECARRTRWPRSGSQRLCRGECYNPSDERQRITRIEIVRIRPQSRPGEPVAPLIEDPWRRFDVSGGSGDGCAVEFDDPDFVAAGRDDDLLRARHPGADAGGQRRRAALRLRRERRAASRCTRATATTARPFDDDCLTPNEERAWSSPIYVRR